MEVLEEQVLLELFYLQQAVQVALLVFLLQVVALTLEHPVLAVLVREGN
jgi:hypothetical protein